MCEGSRARLAVDGASGIRSGLRASGLLDLNGFGGQRGGRTDRFHASIYDFARFSVSFVQSDTLLG
jgi:hypothetical protein